MNKPVLTQEQAKAMESIERMMRLDQESDVWGSKSDVVSFKLRKIGFSGDRRAANEMDDDTFIRALYFGYEVAKEPEVQIREYFASLDRRPLSVPGSDWYESRGIIKTLNMLGIKIEGVNA